MPANISPRAQSYFVSLNKLPKSIKLELISLLSDSLLEKKPRKRKSILDYYGAWKNSPVSDDELISELEKIKLFNHDIEAL